MTEVFLKAAVLAVLIRKFQGELIWNVTLSFAAHKTADYVDPTFYEQAKQYRLLWRACVSGVCTWGLNEESMDKQVNRILSE